jgi:hypothetical protein
MQCLKDYIGLKGCNTAIPASGLYINSLPGISLEVADQIADNEQITYAGVWDDVQARALLRLETDIKIELASRYELKNPRFSFNLGKKIDKTQITAAGQDYRGLVLSQKFFNNVRYSDSVLMIGYVQSLSIYASSFDPEQSTKLLIYDLETQTELYSKDITFDHIGWHDIEINKLLSARQIFIGFDSKGIWDSPKLELIPDGWGWWGGCADECSYDDQIVQGYRMNNDLSGPITAEQRNTYGVSFVGGFQCGFDAIICSNKNLFLNSLLYALGVEMMIERAFSTRINKFTTIDAKKASDMRDYYSTEYKKHIKKIIEAINIDLKDGCIQCNAQIQYIENTP